MGFMAAFGTGFFNQQNKDQANEQSEQDKLTQLSMANILKNVDSYNASKAEYNEKLQKAQAFAAQSGGALQVGDVMNMMNMGFTGQQILMQGMRKAQTPTPIPKVNPATNSSVDQQTQSAMGTTTPASGATPNAPTGSAGGNSPNPPPQSGVAAAPSMDNSQQPTGQIPNLNTHHTIIDSIFGGPTTQDAYNKAQQQAGTVSGLNPDEMSQARTGHYTGGTLPTTPGFNVDSSMLVDWSKFDPAHYSAKNLPAAINAMKQGDIGTAVSLADNADDKTKRELQLEYARHSMDKQDQFAALNKEIDMLAQAPDPVTGKPMGRERASQIYAAHKAGIPLAGGGNSAEEINPNGLQGQAYIDDATKNKLITPAEAAVIPKYASGELPVPKGGKNAVDNINRINALVTSYDPTWSADSAINRPKVRAYMTTGQGGQIIQSASKLVNHGASYVDAIDALNNGNNQIWNSVVNAGKSVMSDPTYQKALNMRHILAEEAAKYFKGAHGVATDQEIKAWEQNLPLDKGPQAAKAAVQELMSSMHGQLDPLADMYNTRYGQYIEGTDLLSPAARKAESHVTGQPVDPVKLQTRSPFHENDNAGSGIWTPPAQQGWTPPVTDQKVQ